MNNVFIEKHSFDEARARPDAMSLVRRSLAKRYRAEKRFKMMGVAAIASALLFLLVLFISIIGNGYPAFYQTKVSLEIYFDPNVIEMGNYQSADYQGLVKASLRAMYPEVNDRAQLKTLYAMVSSGAGYELRDSVVENPLLIGTQQPIWLPVDDEVDMFVKRLGSRRDKEIEKRLKDIQIVWTREWIETGKIKKSFNTTFFTAGDSREPELSGILGALKGSFYILLITLGLSFPVGAAAAVYLEEFAPQNRWTDIIEVNINNLAAVPSIVLGLLGLAVFLNFFGLPRSSPLVGGLVLTLMTLPTIIIAGRAAIKSVPPSIREAALGVGASKMQTVMHHVLPLAMPGMLTGAIIGMARALGETAPLLMIGMVAFIVDIPGGFTDPATALPVQIYLWADSPERGFVERTSAAIMVLLAFLVVMNSLAVVLRKRFERRW